MKSLSSVFLGIFLLIFLKCENPEHSIVSPEMKVGQSVPNGEFLAESINWSWRRVWLEGPNYNGNSATRFNGGTTPSGRGLDASFEDWDQTADTLTYWTTDAVDSEYVRETSATHWDNALKFYTYETIFHRRFWSAKCSTGLTLTGGDNILLSFKAAMEYTGTAEVDVYHIIYFYDGSKWNGNTTKKENYQGTLGWIIYEQKLSVPSSLGDIEKLYLKWESSSPTKRGHVKWDRIKFYSEASNMIPACRISSVDIDFSQQEGYIDIRGEASDFDTGGINVSV